MVDKQSKVIKMDNGIQYVVNRFVDVQKEYDNVAGVKKKTILDQYSEAKQRNIIASAILAIAAELNINDGSNDAIQALSDMQEFINTTLNK
jgi:hypothetical protein